VYYRLNQENSVSLRQNEQFSALTVENVSNLAAR
jgi:hypothetical protein